MTTEDPAEFFAHGRTLIPRDATRVRRVAGIFHGILTGRTDETWPEAAESWALSHDADFRGVLSWYYGLPFARLEAIRNRRRLPALVRRMETKIAAAARSGLPVAVSLVGHSNGGVLVLLVARELIERGYHLDRIVLFAPALRSKTATTDFARWIAEGKLHGVTLVMATRDKTLGLAARFRMAVWPWGSLGVEGWDIAAIPSKLRQFFGTVRLPVGHSDFLAPSERLTTFRRYLAPIWGFDPTREVAA